LQATPGLATTFEDSLVAACLRLQLGLQCTDLTTTRFGRWGGLRNVHSTEQNRAIILNYSLEDLGTHSTYHPVHAQTHRLIGRARGPSRTPVSLRTPSLSCPPFTLA
jgi:hypothetical protein